MVASAMILVVLLLQLVLLFVVSTPAFAGPVVGTNNKKAALEQEVAFLKENLTTVWEMLAEVKQQLERIENEEKVHHHHHHYHHFYHNDSSYPDSVDLLNHTHEVLVNHERTREFKHVHINDGTNHDDAKNGGDHHHYHHFVHHHHPQSEDGGEIVTAPQRNSEKSRHCLLPTNGRGTLANGRNGNKNGHHHHHKPKDDELPVCEPDDPDEIILAEAYCQMRPNRALPDKQRQGVKGTVTFIQKEASLDIRLELRGFQTLREYAHHGHHSTQDLHVHGLHVHEFGDLSNGCESAGGHYNPLGEIHGGPESERRHVGDFGNVRLTSFGNGNENEGKLDLKITDTVASLIGAHSVIGKMLVIHENADDLGLVTDDEESSFNGNSGRRLACCVITKTDTD